MLILQSLLVILQGVVAAALISLVLLQHGKGADAGASFGGGAAGTKLGTRGRGNFLTRSTGILAAIFLANSMLLAYVAKTQVQRESLLTQAELHGTEPSAAAQAGSDEATSAANTAPEGSSITVPVLPAEDQGSTISVPILSADEAAGEAKPTDSLSVSTTEESAPDAEAAATEETPPALDPEETIIIPITAPEQNP